MPNVIPTLDKMPAVPNSATFSLVKIEKVSLPHPYCITPKHVDVAAKYHGGILDTSAIEDAEKRGAACDICRQSGRGILTYAQHETQLTLFIRVPQNRDLNAIVGLHKYLFDNKNTFVQLGIQGFAFPT